MLNFMKYGTAVDTDTKSSVSADRQFTRFLTHTKYSKQSSFSGNSKNWGKFKDFFFPKIGSDSKTPTIWKILWWWSEERVNWTIIVWWYVCGSEKSYFGNNHSYVFDSSKQSFLCWSERRILSLIKEAIRE